LVYLPQSSKEEVLELDHQSGQTSGGGEEANFQNLVESTGPSTSTHWRSTDAQNTVSEAHDSAFRALASLSL